MKAKPQVAAYMNYSLTNVEKVIKAVGYFPEPAAALEKTRQSFIDATK
jgi:endonuclease III